MNSDGLEREGPDADPSMCPSDVAAEDEHEDQAEDPDDVEHIGEALVVAVVDPGDDDAREFRLRPASTPG